MSDSNLSIRNVPPIQSRFSSNDLAGNGHSNPSSKSQSVDIFDDPESPMQFDIATNGGFTPLNSTNSSAGLRERRKFERLPSDDQAELEVVVDFSKENTGINLGRLIT